MIDLIFALKIACGGFGLVFIILIILNLSVRIIRIIVDKIESYEPENNIR